jgi:hypothetical protein
MTGQSYELSYRIADKSSILLKGSTNVNTFTALCNERFPDGKLHFTHREEGDRHHLQFSDTSLHIHTRNLDCGAPPINREMLRTLRADRYPQIIITLCDVFLPKNTAPGTWTELQAHLRVTIAGTSRDFGIRVNALLENGSYHFIGSTEIRMSQFGLRPPTALLGLLKANDHIAIHLDLLVQQLSD